MLLENRLAAIRDQVEKKKADTPSASTSGRAANPPTSAGTTAGGNVSAADEELMRWMDTVRNRINSRWSLLGDQRDLRRVTIVGVRIADDGTLTDAAVDKSSGDEVFDQSAMRAVFQSSPFPTVPPHVRELIRREGGLALRFTPSGIQ